MWVKILSIIWMLLVVPAGLFASVAAFFLLNPGLEGKLLFLSMFTFPLVLVIGGIGGLVCSFGKNAEKRVRQGKFFVLLPFLNVFLFGIAVIINLFSCSSSCLF